MTSYVWFLRTLQINDNGFFALFRHKEGFIETLFFGFVEEGLLISGQGRNRFTSADAIWRDSDKGT